MNWERGNNYHTHLRRKPENKLEGSYMGFHRPTRVVPPSSSSPSNSTFSPGTWFLQWVPQTYQIGSTQFLLSQQLHLLTRYMVPTWGSTDLPGWFHPVPTLPATPPSSHLHGSHMGFHNLPGWFHSVPLLPATLPSHQVHGSYMRSHRPTRVVPPSSYSPSNSTFSPGTWFLHRVPQTYKGCSTQFLLS
jgi:hypothetical protein